MKKFVSAVGMTALFFVIMIFIYYLHVRFFPVGVVFYSALLDAALAALLTGIVLLVATSLPLQAFEKTLLVVIWLLAGYGVAISVPTVLDRSLSFYILEKLQQRGGGIRVASFPDVVTEEFMNEARVVDVRLTEQIESGTITIKNGCVKLTERGDRLATMSQFFRRNFLPKHRLLAGEYTDALVDPFSKSLPGPVGYECE